MVKNPIAAVNETQTMKSGEPHQADPGLYSEVRKPTNRLRPAAGS